MREIDITELIVILLRRIWLIIVVSVLSCAAAFFITRYFITPQYTASIKLYVNNSVEPKLSTGISTSDVSASKSLVDTYITIIQSNTVLESVIEQTGVSYSVGNLSSHLSADAINNTEVFAVSVTTPSPEDSANIANAIADTVPGVLSEIVTGSSVKIIDRAKIPTAPSSPSMMKNVAIGGLLGFVIVCALIILVALLDTRIKTEDDLRLVSDLPVLGTITEFHSVNKSGYGYGYGYTSPKKKSEDK